MIEEDLADASRLTEILARAGYRVRSEAPSADARRRITAEPPALVLLGPRLGGASSLELCARLMGDTSLQPIPVIVIGGLADPAERGQAFRAGCADYLATPFSEEEVLARVQMQIDRMHEIRELERERDRAARYLDVAGVMIVVLDTEARVALVNRKGCELLGYDESEIVGKRWFDHFIPERSRPSVSEVFARIVSGSLELHEHAENLVLTSSGAERLLAWHNAVLRDAAGAIVGTLSSGMDITERVAAEQRLRESEERFRTTLHSIGDGVITTDARGRVQVVNAQAEALTGWSATQARGRPVEEIFRIIDETNRAEVESPVARVLREGAVVGLGNHTLLVARDGTERPIADSGAPIRDERGTTKGVVLVFRDQSDERRTQAELAEAEETFRTFFDHAPIGKSMTAPDGRLLRVNPALCAMLGYSAAELGKLSWASITHPDDLAESAECVRSLLAGERDTWNMEKRYLTKSGEIVWTEVTTRLRRDAAERPVHFLTHVLDISARKQAELDRERLAARLAQSDRLASMGMLAAGVAHEINNPLSYVLFNVESLAQDLPAIASVVKRCCALSRERLGEETFGAIVGDSGEVLQPAMLDDAAARAKEALSGTIRIREIARGLGSFARVERVEHSLVDVRFAIESALKMASNELKYRAEVVKDLGKLPPVWASEGKLAQIFLNLLVNAAHAIDEGDVENNRVTIRGRVDGAEVVLEVSDTGNGIAAEDLPHVFEPFFSRAAPGHGTGLGLAICQSVAVELGGAIQVESELGKGTRFIVRLPIGLDPVDEPKSPPAERLKATEAPRGRVLVVDDEPGIRASLERMLGREHEVVCASSGRAAQQVLEADDGFDLVLCDLMMPEMTGMDLHGWLAARSPTLASRIVFITGGVFTPRAAEYLARAGNLKVEKPIDAAELKKLVAILVGAARGRANGGRGV